MNKDEFVFALPLWYRVKRGVINKTLLLVLLIISSHYCKGLFWLVEMI